MTIDGLHIVNSVSILLIPETMLPVISKSKRDQQEITLQAEMITKIGSIFEDKINPIVSLKSVTANCVE
jgi:hypothetical protein